MNVCPNLDNQKVWMHESILGWIYLVQFKLEKFYRNSAK
jgi:hypothetical protein